MEKEFNNNVTVNIGELATEISSKRLIQYYEQFYPSKTKEQIEKVIYIENEEEVFYTKPAQDLFDQLYDEYYTLIEKLAI